MSPRNARNSVIAGNSSRTMERHLGSSYKTILYIAGRIPWLEEFLSAIDDYLGGYLGDYDDFPLETPKGEPLVQGMFFINTSDNYLYFYVGEGEWTSVYDQVEEGKVELDAAVLAHLATLEQATVAHLLTLDDATTAHLNTLGEATAIHLLAMQDVRDAVDLLAIAAQDSAIAAEAARVATEGYKVAVEADRIQTGLDVEATAADVIQVAQDKSDVAGFRDEVEEDRLIVEAAEIQVSSDASQVALDKVATDAAKVEAKQWAGGISGTGEDTPSDTNNAWYFTVRAETAAEEARNNANQTFKSGGYFKPTAEQEYPDVTGVETDTIWLAKFDNVDDFYVYTSGDLAGTTLKNGFMIVYDTPVDSFDFIPTTMSGAHSVNGVTADGTNNITLGADDFSDILSKTEVLAITNALAARLGVTEEDIVTLQGHIVGIDAELAAVEVELTDHATRLGDVEVQQAKNTTDISLKANEEEVVKLSSPEAGGIDVPRWADDANRPDTSNATVAVLGYNIARRAYEAWNPETVEWGSIGGGGLPEYASNIKFTNFTAERRKAYTLDMGDNVNKTVTIPDTFVDGDGFSLTVKNWTGELGVYYFVKTLNLEWNRVNDAITSASRICRFSDNATVHFMMIDGKISVVDGENLNNPNGQYFELESRVKTISNYNYLINANFSVWQSGELFTLSSDMYCADQWRHRGGETVVSRGADADGLTVNITSAINAKWMCQPVELPKLQAKELQNSDVTLSIDLDTDNLTAITPYTVWQNVTDGTFSEVTTFEPISLVSGNNLVGNTITIPNGGFIVGKEYALVIGWYLGADDTTPTVDSTTTFNSAKFEQGSVATPFISDSPQVNLAKCQRYYWKDVGLSGTTTYTLNSFALVASNNRTQIQFPVTLRTVPSILLRGWTGVVTVDGVTNNVVSLFSATAAYMRIGDSIEADARL